MANEKAASGESFNPAGIKQPIQLLAVVLGLIVISLIAAATALSGTQLWLGAFSLFAAVGITIYVTHDFLSSLKRNPLPFQNPGDYGPGEFYQLMRMWMAKELKDFEEDSSLSPTKPIQTIKKLEILNKALPKKRLEAEEPSMGSTATLVTATLGSYLTSGLHFEKLVEDCFIELNVPFRHYPISLDGPDYIAIRKDMKALPVEVKFYSKRVIVNDLPNRLVNQMAKYMYATNAGESILIISSGITPDALNLIKRSAVKNKIHVVVGDTKEKLKPQLASILL